jgi:hypothetical protein
MGLLNVRPRGIRKLYFAILKVGELHKLNLTIYMSYRQG